MAKIVLTLEDHEGEDGTPGLIIDWDSENDYEETSLAYQYAAAFVQHVMSAAKTARIEDKDGTPLPPTDTSEMN